MLKNFFSFVTDVVAKYASVCNWQSLSCLVCHLLLTQGGYPRRKHLKGAPGLALAFPQILRPDWKGFPRTNALAY
jgi:hypothetical protein